MVQQSNRPRTLVPQNPPSRVRTHHATRRYQQNCLPSGWLRPHRPRRQCQHLRGQE